MTSKARQQRIKIVRDEGRAAFIDGRSRESNPYRDADMMQWANGYDEAKAEHDAQQREEDAAQAQEVKFRLLVALTEYTTAPTPIATQRLSALLDEWEDSIVKRTKQEIENGY